MSDTPLWKKIDTVKRAHDLATWLVRPDEDDSAEWLDDLGRELGEKVKELRAFGWNEAADDIIEYLKPHAKDIVARMPPPPTNPFMGLERIFIKKG